MHPLRALKSGELSLADACELSDLQDDRLLELVGLSLIGTLPPAMVRTAGPLALEIGQAVGVTHLMVVRYSPPPTVRSCCEAVDSYSALLAA